MARKRGTHVVSHEIVSLTCRKRAHFLIKTGRSRVFFPSATKHLMAESGHAARTQPNVAAFVNWAGHVSPLVANQRAAGES